MINKDKMICINIANNLHKLYKSILLSDFLKKNKNLAPQGSIEWHLTRKCSIGGSEMSIITGDNPYQKIDNLVASKVGFTKFDGNIATMWGNLFEPLTEKITEIIFNSNIQETGSLPGSVQNQRYSPDGIGIVKMKCHDNKYNLDCIKYCIVLFEYKAPYATIPDGKIPKHYLPQVKTGLCSIPITDFAIFISNMYRKCSLKDLKNNNIYDIKFHKNDLKKKDLSIELPLSYGIIIIYQTTEQKNKFMDKYFSKKDFEIKYDSDTSNDSDIDFDEIMILSDKYKKIEELNLMYNTENKLYKKINNINTEDYLPIDFGESNYYEFNDLMNLKKENLISFEYLKPNIINSNIWQKNKLINKQNIDFSNIENKNNLTNFDILSYDKENYIGILPWKLLKTDIIYKDRELNYVKKYENVITDTVKILNDINNTVNYDDKVKIFKNKFPNSKLLKKI